MTPFQRIWLNGWKDIDGYLHRGGRMKDLPSPLSFGLPGEVILAELGLE
jgi:hypothetical protein